MTVVTYTPTPRRSNANLRPGKITKSHISSQRSCLSRLLLVDSFVTSLITTKAMLFLLAVLGCYVVSVC
eukprot:6256-Heterococcus_DN1.PRE.5